MTDEARGPDSWADDEYIDPGPETSDEARGPEHVLNGAWCSVHTKYEDHALPAPVAEPMRDLLFRAQKVDVGGAEQAEGAARVIEWLYRALSETVAGADETDAWGERNAVDPEADTYRAGYRQGLHDARERGLDVERLRDAMYPPDSTATPEEALADATEVAERYAALSDRVPGETS